MSVVSDLAYASASKIAEEIKRKRISSVEALEFFLARVDSLDTSINSVVTLDPERARAEAALADAERAAGKSRGALHGVPMTIKDSYQTEGMRTTSGAPELRNYVPEEDAWPVARLREAGAIIYGKTNLPIYAGDLQSYNEIFGTTNNPFGRERTPGGSSGGSAAALACGFTPLELGSDIGGSIRLPSHMSGVVGHKPSYGIVPAHGQIPGPPGTLTLADLAVAGPMARDVSDLEVALDIMSGPNRWESPAWKLTLPPARKKQIGDYRIAAWLDDAHCPVQDDVRTLLENAASELTKAGAIVDPAARPTFSLEKISHTFMALLQSALAGGVSRDKIEEFARSTGSSSTDETRRLFAMRHREWLSFNERRMQMRKRWEEFFATWDAILLPVMPCPAIKHDQSEPQAARTVEVGGEMVPYWDLIAWMAPAGACFLPSTVVPVGQVDNGLPVGVQVVGAYLNDKTTLHIADRLSELMGGCPRPQGF